MGNDAGTIQLSPSTWTSASTTTNVGHSDNSDLTNEINQALNSLMGSLNTIGFLTSSKNFITALEDFGSGLAGALACVGTDLLVVGSGLAAAASAFGALDQALVTMFKQLDSELGYYVNTTAASTLPAASASANAALSGLTISDSSSSDSSSWFSFSIPHIAISPPTPAETGTLAGTILIIGVIILLSPVGA